MFKSKEAANDNVVHVREGCSLKASLQLGLHRAAFTMAEILLSLTIIGVVAAITLPSLTGNINERTWNTQRKALYSRMSQAVALMSHLNGYGTISSANNEHNPKLKKSDNAAETFLSAGLSKVFKLNNICDSSHLSDCGLPDKIVAYGGSSAIYTSNLKMLSDLQFHFSEAYCDNTPIETPAAAFETANGESILLHYNPLCIAPNNENVVANVRKFCANMVYDLNGKKGPNTMGKDIGVMSILYSFDSIVVAPMPVRNILSGTYTQLEAKAACGSLDDARLPSFEETLALWLNKPFFIPPEGWQVMTSARKVDPYTGAIGPVLLSTYVTIGSDTTKGAVWCLKRD